MKIGIDIGGSHIGVGLVEESKIIDSKEKILKRQDRQNINKVSNTHLNNTQNPMDFGSVISKASNTYLNNTQNPMDFGSVISQASNTCLNNTQNLIDFGSVIGNSIVVEIQNMILELLLENNLQINDISLIGVACPGTISSGKIVKAGNLNIRNFDLLSELKKKYDIPIQMRNDGKCAALAEKVYGAMKEYDDGIFLNIGTGIGGAAFMGGKLLEPKRYSGFEFGHMIVNKGGKSCSCGKQGCLESYASIKALKTKVAETLDIDSDISGQYLREEILTKEDPRIEEDIEVFVEYLKTGVCNLIDIFEPEVICFGGSFSYYEGTSIFNKLIEKIENQKATFNEGGRPKIVTARFKNDAGIIGATIK